MDSQCKMKQEGREWFEKLTLWDQEGVLDCTTIMRLLCELSFSIL